MMSRRWLGVLVVGLCCIVAVSGCKKKPRSGAGLDSENIGGVAGSGGLYGDDSTLSARPGEGSFTEMAGQFQPVYFDYDSSTIGGGEAAKCDAVAEYLSKNAAVGVIVEGNCDERGSEEYNLALGERRALAIRAYLVSKGIDGSRIQTKSYGEDKPVAFGHDEESWRLNRRGEFVLFQ